jgi:Tfp pilus assembly protein PilN
MVRRINLVPPSERRRTQSDVGLLILLVIVVVVLGALGYAYFHYQGVLTDRENDLAQVQAEIQKVQQQLAALAQYEELQQNKDQIETVVQQIYAGRTLVSEILGDISLVVPKEAWFQSMVVSAPDISAVIATFAGQVQPTPGTAAPTGNYSVSGNTYTFEDVARVMVRFEQVPSFINVNLGTIGSAQGSTDPTKKVKGFSLSAGVINTQDPNTALPLTQVEVQPTGGTSQ